MKKLIKGSIVVLLLITTIFSDVKFNIRSETFESAVEAAESGSNTYSPNEIPNNQDGYGYAKVGITSNHYGEEVPQMWSYHDLTNDEGWMAYVEEGTKTLYISGELTEAMGTGGSNTGLFMPTVFENDGYTGDIISMSGISSQFNARTGLLTSTGEIWYTGSNGVGYFSSSTQRINYWKKYDTSKFDGKVVSFVNTPAAIVFITDTNKIYFSGWIGHRADFTSDEVGWGNHYGVDITNATTLGGEKPIRVFELKNASLKFRDGGNDDDGQNDQWNGERLFIIETDKGYISGAERRAGQYVLGVNDGSFSLTNDSFSRTGFQKVYMRDSSGTYSRIPAGYIQDIVYIRNPRGVHILGTDGKIYTGGRFWNNKFTQGATSGSARSSNTTTGTSYAWDYNVFQENTALGSDNARLFPGMDNLIIEKTNGNIMMAGELKNASGALPNNVHNISSNCSTSVECYSPLSVVEGGSTSNYYFNSTNWNKTEVMTREYILGLDEGSLAIDQDGFLRMTVNDESYGDAPITDSTSQLTYPVVTNDSSIRNSESYSILDREYVGDDSKSNFSNSTNYTNARVRGEYLLVDMVKIASPVYDFEGEDAQVLEGIQGEDHIYNPMKINLGPIYDGTYTLNKDKSESLFDGAVELKYRIYNYTYNESSNSGVKGSAVTNEITLDATKEMSVDLSGFNAGWYLIESYRTHTTAGNGNEPSETYSSGRVLERFYISGDPTLYVDDVVVVKDSDVSIASVSNKYAYQRPSTTNNELSDQIFIKSISSTISGDAVSKTSTEGSVNSGSNNAKITRNIEETISASDSDSGVYNVEYAVNGPVDGYSATRNQVLIVDDGSIGYTDGDEYAIRSESVVITTTQAASYTDAHFKSDSNLS